jgi:hypothetical protein
LNMNGNGHRGLRNFFWVCAVHKASGRPIVQGPHNTFEEANQFGFLHVKDGDFKVYEFPTRNKVTARDMFKSKRLEETGMLEDVFKRAKYK